jgi:serine protease Do
MHLAEENKMKRIITAFLLVSLVVSMSGCLLPMPIAPATSPPESGTPSVSTPVSPIDTSWSPPQPKVDAPVLPSIADVVEKVYPSVVAINTEVVTLDIFRTPRTQKGAGSGWIIDKDGIIVTNNHVVEGAEKVTVELSDGRIFEADPKDIRTDPLTDLAVVKINATNLPAASVGDSTTLRVGDWVVAIGNPLGQGIRAKEGTISGLKVSLDVDQGQTLGDLIETSAAINPGNSGGPLVNMKAEVIGITSAKIAAVGVEGLGYAISTKTARPIIEQLIKQGYVTRPWLGVTLYTVDQYVAMVNNLPVSKGAVIAYVKTGSPAAKAGLQQLDVITSFKDKEVTTAEEVISAINDSKIGDDVTITFVRGNETKTTHARLIQSPPPGS